MTDMPIFQRARLGMGYLPQESSIFRGLTVEQNLRAVLETLEDHDDERDATLDDLMAEFGITHLRNTPSVSLSGGERRRLEIARALAAQPTFLLLDEPLAGIDPIALGEIRDLIRPFENTWNWRFNHRPQCSRNVGYCRSCIHYPRWHTFDGRFTRRGGSTQRC